MDKACSCLSWCAALLLAAPAALAAQGQPVERGRAEARRRGQEAPLLKENAGTTPSPGATPESGVPRSGAAGPLFGGAQQGGELFGDAAAAGDDPAGPRPLPPNQPPPFHGDRPVIEVDGVSITTGELNDLVLYYQTFRPGSTDLLLRDAVEALLPRAAVQARYGAALAAMKARIDEARQALETGMEFAEAVVKYSDDDESENAGGLYHFGREQAVQPFDRHAHSGRKNELQGPFLSKYGYHLLEIVGYQRDVEPKKDRSDVRHILVRFPFQDQDVRAEIRRLVDGCRIRVLDPGLANLIPPERRGQVVTD